MMETARDTLFLSDLPARRLPWAYLCIALLALTVGGAINVLTRPFPRGHIVTATLLGGALGNVALWHLCADRRPETLFALYVWTGLIASLVTIQFWLRAGSVLDVGRAKRVFTLIGAGGLAGATLGAALAAVVLQFAPPRTLILGATALFVAAAAVNQLWGGTDAPAPPVPAPPSEGPGPAPIRRDPYLWRLLLLTVVATVVVTGLDYVFKSVVADQVARGRLGPFLARYHTVVNASALVFQLLIAPRVIQGAGVVGALLLLPTLILIGTAASAALGGLAWILAAKAADGTMRHSLDRAGNEILHLPLADGVREHFRALTTGIGQRGGQALASVVILTAVSLGASHGVLAVGLGGLSAAWIVVLLRLRSHYVGQFREQLRSFKVGSHGTLPPLDLEALEILVVALGSSDDAEVLAALDMLEAYDKQHLVSPLIVHHPSRDVALRALTLLAQSSRTDLPRLVDRALRHPDGEVRAAVLRLRTAQEPDERLLRHHLQDETSPVVRCAALVGLVSGGFLAERESEEALHELLENVTADACPTLAHALVDLPPRFARPLARELSRHPDARFGVAVARALAAAPSIIFLETLVELLAPRDGRTHARDALVALGDEALAGLERALEDTDTPAAVRLHLPRSISRFGSPRAAAVLVTRLLREDDSRVRYKILRGLGRMRADDPKLPIDGETLRAAADTMLARAAALLTYRVAWDLLAAGGEWPQRGSAALLPALLEEKERRALEGVFRVLHVLQPSADYALVSRGIAATDASARASGREILENVLDGPLKPALLAMTDSLAPEARLAAVLKTHEQQDARALLALVGDADRPALLARAREILTRLLEDPNPIVREIARFELETPERSNPREERADAS